MVDQLGRNVIEAARLDGRFRSVILHQGLQRPRDIVVDSSSGLMFWTHSTGSASSSVSSTYGSISTTSQPNSFGQSAGAGAVIERASMDGSERKRLIRPQNTWPHGLTLDYRQKVIYFCDANQRKIERIDYEGNGRHVILSSDDGAILRKPYALAVYAGYLYWTDFELRAVKRLHLNSNLGNNHSEQRFPIPLAKSDQSLNDRPSDDSRFVSTHFQSNHKFTIDMENLVSARTGDWSKANDGQTNSGTTSVPTVQTLLTGLENLMDVQVFHGQRPSNFPLQHSREKNCSELGCSQLCILHESLPPSCRCATGLRLQSNRRDCASDMSRFLLIAKRRMISRVSLDVGYFAEVAVRLPMQPVNLSNVITLDADVISKRIFWSDTALKVIYSGVYGSVIFNDKPNKSYRSDLQTRRSAISGEGNGGSRLEWPMDLNVQSVPGYKSTVNKDKVSKKLKKKIPRKLEPNPKKHPENAKPAVEHDKNIFATSDDLQAETRAVHRVGLQDVNGLAVDSVGRMLYWTDAIKKRIEVSQLDGKLRKILIYQDLDR